MNGVGLMQLLGGASSQPDTAQKIAALTQMIEQDSAGISAQFQQVIEEKIAALQAEDPSNAALPGLMVALGKQVPATTAGGVGQSEQNEELAAGLMAHLAALVQQEVTKVSGFSPEMTAELEAAFLAQQESFSPEFQQLFGAYLAEPTAQNLGELEAAIAALDTQSLLRFADVMSPAAAEAMAGLSAAQAEGAAALFALIMREFAAENGHTMRADIAVADMPAALVNEMSQGQAVPAAMMMSTIAMSDPNSMAEQHLAVTTALRSPSGAMLTQAAGEEEVPPAILAFASMAGAGKGQAESNAPAATLSIGEVVRALRTIQPANDGAPSSDGASLLAFGATQAGAEGAGAGGSAFSNQFVAQGGFALPQGMDVLPAALQASVDANAGATGGDDESDILTSALRGAGDTSLEAMRDEGARPTAERLNRDVPHPREQVVVEIKQHLETGKKQFMIQLDPADLGRVEVRIDTGADGKTQIMITADNGQTLDLLQRDARSLWKSLTDLGLQLEQSAMEFQLAQDQAGGQQQQEANEFGGSNAGAAEHGTAFASNNSVEQYNQLVLTLDQGVNIRV